jgi:glycosyltransferase involved in cell wall biosynthesis
MNWVIAVSSAVKADLIKKKVDQEIIKIVYNGISKSGASSNTRKRPESQAASYDASFIIGVVGRLSAVKGHAYAIRAMKAVVAKQPGCKMVFAGDGPLRYELLRQISASGLENHVQLLGYVQGIDAFLSEIDVFLMPSISEGLPMALLEALNQKIPVIATKVGGIPEVIRHNKEGLLVKPGNPSAIAAEILSLQGDEDKRRKMAQAGFHMLMTKFSDDIMVDEYMKIYAKCIETVS